MSLAASPVTVSVLLAMWTENAALALSVATPKATATAAATTAQRLILIPVPTLEPLSRG